MDAGIVGHQHPYRAIFQATARHCELRTTCSSSLDAKRSKYEITKTRTEVKGEACSGESRATSERDATKNRHGKQVQSGCTHATKVLLRLVNHLSAMPKAREFVVPKREAELMP